MNVDQRLVDTYLDRAVEEFDVNPISTQLIRRLANEEPDLFVVSAMRQMATSQQSNAHRFLSILMLRQQQVLLDHLTDPGESRDKSVHLFQRVVAIDPAFDVKLARKLPDRIGSNHHEALRGARAGRTLEILDQTSRGRRLLPILGHLVDSDDPRTREKATLFIGRRVQSPIWAEKQLKRPDERIRANAVESIWGLHTPSATNLLEVCAMDTSNRVAGNALIGLFLAGQRGVEADVKRMASEANPRFRSTAAWAMGKMAALSFVPRLTEMVRDDQPAVRGAALRSLIEIRRFEAHTPEALAAKAAITAALAPVVAEELMVQVEEVIEYNPTFNLRLDGSRFATNRR
jgi:hypothetical protein